MPKANSSAHTKWLCKYHIVFTPKYRRKIIYNQYKRDLAEILHDLCAYKGVEIIEGHLEKALNMNRRSLTIIFKSEMGETIPAYILRKKIEEAGYLLKFSRLNISEISSLLCFSSQSHFTQQFRSYYGITPKQYRDKSAV